MKSMILKWVIGMSDKFDKMSIYAVDWKTVNNDGEEVVFTFQPLPFKHYPRIYKVLGELQKLESSKDEALSDEEQSKRFLERLSPETVDELLGLELEMVRKSYPELSESRAELFVTSNVFGLVEPLVQLMGRAEKYDQRKTSLAR